MGNRQISPDLKLAAVHLHEQGVLSTQEIIDYFSFSRHTFWCIRKLYHETGDVVKPHSGYTGQPQLLNLTDIQYLITLVNHQPNWFLDKLASLLQQNHFISVHFSTIHWELICAGVSLKKLCKVASE
ncbi:hypothetical protein PISMIDRAFT_31295 [Pisolithus microcarpus 441]|uniref:Helix-turn-helix domain-containing protein n=1 Tax=Pisolithus microcarpus 441 TaxID=765257 RepID=A0A0C9YTN9_9AGAM|nr:hypothetical protein PISMIDRAFT_31295 [Pisolithus microcarpus 441]